MKIEKRLELTASPERVWRALTDARELARWFPDEADFELRPGAIGSLRWESHGRYQIRTEEFDPPHRLVWSWARDPDVSLEETQVTTVEWILTPLEGGGTLLELCESGFVAPEHREGNEKGWTHELQDLVDYLASEAVSA